MSGKFIVFEGPDGSGKTTQIKLLGTLLEQKGHQVVYTREPGGTEISEKIRAILLDPQNKMLSDKTEVLLYAAARAQHVDELIRPNLEAGKIVICDRFTDSTLAYQGYGRQINIEYLVDVNNKATSGLVPDIVLLIDLKPEKGLERILKSRGKNGQEATDRIEQEEISFHQRVREGFLALAKNNSERYIILNGEDSIEDIKNKILAQIENKLGL